VIHHLKKETILLLTVAAAISEFPKQLSEPGQFAPILLILRKLFLKRFQLSEDL
jgi:hypothetical protein